MSFAGPAATDYQTAPKGAPLSCREVPLGTARYEPSGGRIGRVALDDALAISLKAALGQITAPLALAAASFVRQHGWVEFGHCRLDDHARERYGRSGRWLRDLAALGRAIGVLPDLAEALTGEDGGRPIGRVAAVLIARVATPDSASLWIERARAMTVREIRESVGSARGDDKVRGRGDLPSSAQRGREDDAPGCQVKFFVPEAVCAIFEETLDLYRAVVGREATVTSFIEALVAEAMAGLHPPSAPDDIDQVALRRTEHAHRVETALADVSKRWADLPSNGEASWAMALAGISLSSLDATGGTADEGDAIKLDHRIRHLLALEDRIEARLGELLAQMAEQGAWSRLRFAGVGHYAEQRLGMSRSSAQDRVRLARGLRRLAVIRSAYDRGTIGLEAALSLVRILGGGPASTPVQKAWVRHASRSTVKRIRDEARALKRVAVLGATRSLVSRETPLPTSDRAWHESLRRAAGTARHRVDEFGLRAIGAEPDSILRFRLPAELAEDFVATVDSARRKLTRLVENVAWDRPWPDPNPPASLLAARMFSTRALSAPSWVGLLSLLEDFVHTWDPAEPGAGRPGDPVYIRDGWRCTAPGCSSRRNLENHHIVYRSRGGPDIEENQTCLCRFHHQRGEHGGLASCRGKAPLGLVWSMGQGGIGGTYRNEKRMGYGAGVDSAGNR